MDELKKLNNHDLLIALIEAREGNNKYNPDEVMVVAEDRMESPIVKAMKQNVRLCLGDPDKGLFMFYDGQYRDYTNNSWSLWDVKKAKRFYPNNDFSAEFTKCESMQAAIDALLMGEQEMNTRGIEKGFAEHVWKRKVSR